MGKLKLFPTAEYTSKQPRDPIVPRVPCTGIFLGPSKSGKTVALISAILDQYMTSGGESVFERIYIFSPSIEIDDSWKPVKEFIEHRMGVNTEREQVYFDKWDEGALRGIIEQQKKITRKTKEMGQKTEPNFGRNRRFRGPTGAPPPHRRRGAGHALHPRAPHADLHLGLEPDAAAHQRRRPREHAVHVRLAPPQPARAGSRSRGAHGPAAQEGAAGHLRGSDPGAVQLPLHPLPEAPGRNVLQALGGTLCDRKWGPS